MLISRSHDSVAADSSSPSRRSFRWAAFAHLSLAALMSVSVVPSANATGTFLQQTTKIVPQRLVAGDQYGASVAMLGNVAVVGSPGDDTGGLQAGAAYVYRFDGLQWNIDQRLFASDAVAGDEFGFSVAISAGVIVVGARSRDTLTGAAYVFRFNGSQWQEEEILEADDGSPFDMFGSALAISGDVIAVGALRDTNANGAQAGSVYVFQFDGGQWNQDDTLLASDGAAADLFGLSVGISDDLLVVGAPNHGGSGAAYGFRFNEVSLLWEEEVKLQSNDGANGDLFGASVTAADRTIVVGAPGDADAGADTGSAYAFQQRLGNDLWRQLQKIRSDDPQGGDEFGAAVSLERGLLVIGSPLADVGGMSSGCAFLWRRNLDNKRFRRFGRIEPQVTVAQANFGSSVAAFGDNVFVGAPNDSEVGISSGSAYPYHGQFLLEVGDQTLATARTLKFQTSGGLPGQPVLLALVEGHPRDGLFLYGRNPVVPVPPLVNFVVEFGEFGNRGIFERTYTFNDVDAVSGTTLFFQALGSGNAGPVYSNPVPVEFK